MDSQLSDVLDRARRDAGLSLFELWLRYFGLGGMSAPLELEAFLVGALRPSVLEHDLVVAALNERFAELGQGRPVSYSDPRITLGDRLGRVHAALGDIDGNGPGSWDRVCGACAEALSMTGAGIALLAGGEQRTSLGASDEAAATIEEGHFTLGEGPGVDAGRLGVPVHEPDLAAAGQTRWPMFAASALDAGVAAISALPLRVGAERIGTMNLYRDQPGPLSPPQLADALAVANLIAQAVLALQAHAPTETLARRLADVPFRAVVHQATGMISAQLDTGVAEALIRLRSYAYAQDRPIDEIADLVVAGTLRFDDQPD
jgi:hypothetical protein